MKVATSATVLAVLLVLLVAASPSGCVALRGPAPRSAIGSGLAPAPLAASSNVGPTAQASAPLVAKQMHLEPTSPPLLLVGNLTPDAPTTGSVSTFALAQGGPAANFYLDLPFAKAFQAQNLSAILYVDSATGASVPLDLNLTVYDWNGVSLVQVISEQWHVVTNNVVDYQKFTFTFAPVNHTFARGDQVRLQILNENTSAMAAVLAAGAMNADSQLDVLTTTYVNIDRLLPPSGSVLSPKDSLVIQANVSDPFGSREVAGAQLSVTDPMGNALLTYAAMPVVQSGTSWTLFRRSLPPPLTNGTYGFSVVAVEGNGATDTSNGSVLVRAPAFTLQKVPTVAQAKSGTKFAYLIWYNNTGSGPAGTVWINDTLPSQLTFQSSIPSPAPSSGPTYTWVLPSVSTGPHVIQINVQVKGGLSGVAYIRNWVSLNDTDERGYLWPMLMAHGDVVVNGPLLTLSVSSVPATFVHANETVVDTIGFTNTGDAAQTVWVNVTLPAGLSYVSDTSGPLGGARTSLSAGVECFRFANMPAGTGAPISWTFTITAAAAPALPRGTDLLTVVGLNDSSANGLWMPDQVRTFYLLVASPLFTAASVQFAGPTTVAYVPTLVFVNLTNAGNEPARAAWVNLTLDPFLRFVGAGVPASVANGIVTLGLSGVAVGADSVPLEVAAIPFTPDRRVVTLSGSANYTDGFGNDLPGIRIAAGSVLIAEPLVSLRVSPVSTTAEAGTQVAYALTAQNQGSGTASSVWLNVSLPASLEYVADTFGVTPATVGSNYSWALRDLGSGPHTYAVVLAVAPMAADGSSAGLLFRLQSFDAGGNPQNATSVSAHVDVVAPGIQGTAWAEANESLPGGTVTYVLRVANTGSTAARFLWVTDAIDLRLQVITYTAPVPATGTTTLNWTFTDVQPGQGIQILLLVKVADNATAHTWIPNVAEVRFTNSVGAVLGYVRVTAGPLEVVPDLAPLLYIVAGGCGLGALLVVVVYRRYRVSIEDVFLVYRDGILITHLSRTLVQEKDEDQLSGMLTAVQDFVKDAFRYGEHRELHQLEFGDYHVLIERGASVYLAVVYQGRDSGLIRRKVRDVLDRVESAYGAVFAKWDGDMGSVVGTRDLIRSGLLETRHPWSLVRAKAP